MKEIMKRAHSMTKRLMELGCTGTYRENFRKCLKAVWKIIRYEDSTGNVTETYTNDRKYLGGTKGLTWVERIVTHSIYKNDIFYVVGYQKPEIQLVSISGTRMIFEYENKPNYFDCTVVNEHLKKAWLSFNGVKIRKFRADLEHAYMRTRMYINLEMIYFSKEDIINVLARKFKIIVKDKNMVNEKLA